MMCACGGASNDKCTSCGEYLEAWDYPILHWEDIHGNMIHMHIDRRNNHVSFDHMDAGGKREGPWIPLKNPDATDRQIFEYFCKKEELSFHEWQFITVVA